MPYYKNGKTIQKNTAILGLLTQRNTRISHAEDQGENVTGQR